MSQLTNDEKDEWLPQINDDDDDDDEDDDDDGDPL